MGVYINKNLFGELVTLSEGMLEVDDKIFFPDYINAPMSGTFTDKRNISAGTNVDRSLGVELYNLDAGVVRINRTSNTGQSALNTTVFNNVTTVNESSTPGVQAAKFVQENIKYLYNNPSLPLNDNKRLFVKLNNIEYRISSVTLDTNIYDENGNSVEYYYPTLAMCYNGNIIWERNLFGYSSLIQTGIGWTNVRLFGADLVMILCKITNFDPTVTLQRRYMYGDWGYAAYLNGYIEYNGQLYQDNNHDIFIPIFIMTNTYIASTTTKVMISYNNSWYTAGINDKISPLKLLRESLNSEYAYTLIDMVGDASIISPYNISFTNYNSALDSILNGQQFDYYPSFGVEIGLTYDPVVDASTDNIVYNAFNAIEGPGPDEEELEEADDLNTEYDLEQGDGEEQFNYRNSDQVNGEPGAINVFRPSYANYIFKKMRFTQANETYNVDVFASMLQDIYTVSFNKIIYDYFCLTGQFDPSSVISRVYYLPFEYDELIHAYDGATEAGVYESTPYIPVAGPILASWSYGVGPVWPWEDPSDKTPSEYKNPTKGNLSYYKQLANKFYTLDLGQLSVSKVFNNYLDYQTEYVLNLPYGAGQVSLDTDILFNGVDTATIKLKGFLDVEEGSITIKVKVNEQLYYETTAQVSIDASIATGGMFDIGKSLVKMPFQVAKGVGVMMNGGSSWAFANNMMGLGTQVRNYIGASDTVKQRMSEDAKLRTQRHLNELHEQEKAARQPITIGSGSIESFDPNPNFNSDVRHKFKPINKAAVRAQEMMNELIDYVEGR